MAEKMMQDQQAILEQAKRVKNHLYTEAQKLDTLDAKESKKQGEIMTLYYTMDNFISIMQKYWEIENTVKGNFS